MCKFCEGDNLSRENIMYDFENNPVCIWDNRLLIDDNSGLNSEVINYCPMCRRKLN